jgi:alpha-ribazole phosphatase/probable phosphoglycerate mutase
MDLTTPHGVTRLILVRHAEPAEEVRRRYARRDGELSRRGHGQAEACARWLRAAPIDRVFASPSGWARETAAPLARTLGLEVVALEAFRGLSYGELEGLEFEDAQRRFPEVHAAWLERPAEVSFPGGESYADLRGRVRRATAELRAQHAQKTIAIVSHGEVNRTAIAEALNLADEDSFRVDQDHCAINIVDYVGDAPVVRLVNAVP